ncbi:MAG: HAMP domain-containing sensor histidine kinase, partial [Kiloniellales bacterium]
VAISTDISELKIREIELRDSKEQAELANRSKSEFLANMSHELRTPLNAVIGFSEMMQRETFGPLGDDQYKQYAKDIFDSGTHLLSLISDILDLSKIEAGELELKEEAVDVAQAVGACRRIIEGRTKEAGLTLATRLSGNLPKLFADERAVKQIVLNLLSNAIKFTPAGGRVTVHAGVDEDGCFVLSVSDTGIGIGPDDIPKVLTPFSQVDGSATRGQEGSGLGLPLVKSLVESHGGTIELESELGDGTIATVRFPAERVLSGPAETEVDDIKAGAA